MPIDQPTESPPPPSGVLERGLLLLRLFTMQRNRLFLREFAALSGLDKSTCLRALKALTTWGFLERHPDGSYSPGPANMRLAAIFRTGSNLLNRLEGPINKISQQVNQTTAFFIRSEDQRICLARSRQNDKHTHFVEIGVPIPLSDGGSAAHVLAAFTEGEAGSFDQKFSQGYIASHGERLRHYASISIPIFEVDGAFLGAITISGLSMEFSHQDMKRFAEIAKTEMNEGGFLTSNADPNL